MACGGAYFSPLLLHSILFVASKHIPERQGIDAVAYDEYHRQRLRTMIEDALYQPDTRVISKSSITTVQALLLVSDAIFSWYDERSLSWHYLGLAINMIMDLGMHVETANQTSYEVLSAEDLEIRRRVFWAAYGRRLFRLLLAQYAFQIGHY